ncbi:hypothetical protein [Bradyrhizobium sp.]|jgi:hypothetical protein
MKRTFHLLGQAVPLVLLWAPIVEMGFRMQEQIQDDRERRDQQHAHD